MTADIVQPDIFATGMVNLEAYSQSRVGAGRYVLIKILGRGGMGIVWRGRDELLATDVALKFLPPQIRFDPVALDDLRRETSRSRKLTHPNIIRIHDFYEAKNEDAFISMELVEGSNLASLRVERPQRIFSWEFLAPLVKQLCDGLEYAHSERVIHRDLKPANLMLDIKGRLKLADFGIARTLSETMTRVSANPGTSGTLLYMSPQQLEGKPPCVADDIYALGATLYELLTGKPPFYSGDFLHQIRNVAPAPLHQRLKEWEITNEIPAQVEKVILACLEKDEAKRPKSAEDVAIQMGLIPNIVPKMRLRRSHKIYWQIGGMILAAAAASGFYFSAHAKKIADPWKEVNAPPMQMAPIVPAKAAPAPAVTAPVVRNEPKDFTALQFVQLGDHYVTQNARDQVIAMISDKTVGDLVPKNWRILYHNEKATFNTTEIDFANNAMTRIHEPNRFFQMFSGANKPIDLSQVALDSDDALKIVMNVPEVRAASVIAVQMQLNRGYGGMPVWTVNLFGQSDSEIADDKNLGTIQLLADSGKILKNTLIAKSQ